MDHNNIDPIDRGKWRKYNPYNPYKEESEDDKQQNTSIESLDDLFDEPDVGNDAHVVPNIAKDKEKDTEAPMLPQDDLFDIEEDKKEDKKEDTEDLQKELEAKFDELFGAFDDED